MGATTRPRLVSEVSGMTQEARNYIETAPEEWLLCREGRHRYRQVPLSEMRFHTNSLGEDVVHIPCEQCQQAYQERKYVFHTDKEGRVVRTEYLGAQTKYYDSRGAEGGYLLPAGSGYIGGRDMHEHRIASFMEGRKVRRKTGGGTIAKRGIKAS